MKQGEINKAMKDYQDAMIEKDAKQNTQKDKCLVFIKNLVSQKKFDEIISIIEDSEYTFDFKLTKEPKGAFQDEEYLEFIKGIYVNQTTDGGFTGDEFAGTISIEYNDGLYLKFNYSM